MKIFKRTPETRFLFFLASDVFLIALSLYASFILRFDFTLPDQYRPYILYYVAICLVVLLPFFYFKRLYHFTWIYVSINTLISIVKAVTYGFLFLALLLFLGREHILAKNLPRSIVLIDYVLVLVSIGSLRISKRIFYELTRWSTKPKINQKPRIVIIGAGDAAEQLIRNIRQSKEYPFSIAGILDDSNLKQNTTLHGIPVLGRIADLPRLKEEETIYGVIIAIPSATTAQVNQILSLARNAGITYTKILPSLAEFMDQRVSIKDVRDIKVEDLLGRDKIDISFTEIEKLIHDRTVLITGAAGSIGTELATQVSKLKPKKLICLDIDETRLFELAHMLNNATLTPELAPINILDTEKIKRIFSLHKPAIVFHTAAYKHVGMMEKMPDESIKTNVLGTWTLAEASKQSGVEKFVLISTDKAVNPTSVMGMSKRIAEMLIGEYNNAPHVSPSLMGATTTYIAVRFGNVLGSRGSVVPIFKNQIMSGGPVTITHPDMERYFMVPSEAILLVLQAACLGEAGEVFVLDMGRPVKILALAETMIRLAGFEPYTDIPIIFTKPQQGEKLYETLLTDAEQMEATKHKKIFIAKPDSIDNKEMFLNKVKTLCEYARQGRNEEIRTLMKEIILNP